MWLTFIDHKAVSRDQGYRWSDADTSQTAMSQSLKHLSDCQYRGKRLPRYFRFPTTATVERDNSNTRHLSEIRSSKIVSKKLEIGQCYEVMDFDRRGLPSVSEDCLIYLCVNTLDSLWVSISLTVRSLDHSLSAQLIGRLRDLLSRSLSGRLILPTPHSVENLNRMLWL